MSSLDLGHPIPVSQVTLHPMVDSDDPWFEALCARAFGPGRFARAAFRVREQIAPEPDLCLTASIEGRKVGGVLMTPISLSGHPGYLLGPLATEPEARNKGAGRALVREVCRMALERGDARFVLLVGDYAYYGPLGFARTTEGAITFPGSVDPARILANCRTPNLCSALHGPVSSR